MLKVSARLFPIGFIISVDASNFDPHDFYVGGNWERVKGKVIVGLDENQTEFNTTGKTGGTKTHTLTIAEMPSHNHKAKYQYPFTAGGNGIFVPATNTNTATGSTTATIENIGGGGSHNNLQPYQTAYVWKLISYSN